MPGLFTPQLSITIDRRRMIADCTIETNIAPLIDGSDRPFPDEFRLEARLENHDTVRLRLLYTFDQRIVRADLNRTSRIGDKDRKIGSGLVYCPHAHLSINLRKWHALYA